MFTWNPCTSEVKNGFIKSVPYVKDYTIEQSIQRKPAFVSKMTAKTS